MGRVLVVDDDPAQLGILSLILEPLGLEVVTTLRADEALQLLQQSRFDLVVSDLSMPGVDGLDLIEVMRGRGDHTAVLFMSGSGNVSDVVQLMKLGAAGYIEKPFSASTLKREVLHTLKSVHAKSKSASTQELEPSVDVVIEPVDPSGRSSQPPIEAKEVTLPTNATKSTLSQEPTAAAPVCLGRYEVRALIAAGGMGRVYRAYDPQLDRMVALKTLRPPTSPIERAQFLPRFKREAVALAKLHHPNIVPVYDTGIDTSGEPFVVMELIEGTPLSHLLDEHKRLPPSRALSIALQVAEALAFAHAQGVVHRDVKPDNVIVGANDWVRLIDFGVAHTSGSELTGTSTDVLGSPSYLSPEAASGKPIDWRADQFSLASVILEMLSGQRIFRGDTLIQSVRNVCERPAPTLKELGIGGAPGGLQSLLTRMHAKDPARRVQDEREVLDGLRYAHMRASQFAPASS